MLPNDSLNGQRQTLRKMEVVQRLLQILKVYQDNSELISTAVKDLRRIEGEGLSLLRQGYEERKRKFILKAVALLAPSDIPAKVVEVDGVDDAELMVCQAKGWLNGALAIYLRHDHVSNALTTMCEAELGDSVGFYATSAIAAVWDHVELGDEGLTELVKPSVFECADSGRQVLENARRLCQSAYLSPPGEPVCCHVLAFEASRDDHRRFALVTAVLVESATGKVIFYDRNVIRTSDVYTLDTSSGTGLDFQIMETGDNKDDGRSWAGLAVLCSMFAEVSRLPHWKGRQLVNSIVLRLEWGLKACKDQLDALTKAQSTTWIPSRQDLKLIHNRSDESTRNRLHRSFTAREALLHDLKMRTDPGITSGLPAGKAWVLNCLADRSTSHLGRRLVKAYEDQRILPVQIRDSGCSSIFATYIYSSLGRPVVAEEYRHLFSNGKVNVRRAKSGTLLFVPHSGLVTMTTHGMICKAVQVENSQIFDYDSADRFALLPHLLEILGLREDDALLSTLVREMDDNAYLVADPLTSDVRACMTRSFEAANRSFRVSTLHDAARQAVGAEHFQGLVREAVSLLARLGAMVPPEYVSRSCFYDVTRDLKKYQDVSRRIHLLFDRGVTLDRLSCDVSLDGTLAIIHTQHKEAHVIAPITVEKNLRRHPPPDNENEEMRAMEAALKEAGLVMMRPVFEVHGELHMAVTRSDPGRGLFSLFNGCEAK
jgi:hypothetical protein